MTDKARMDRIRKREADAYRENGVLLARIEALAASWEAGGVPGPEDAIAAVRALGDDISEYARRHVVETYRPRDGICDVHSETGTKCVRQWSHAGRHMDAMGVKWRAR